MNTFRREGIRKLYCIGCKTIWDDENLEVNSAGIELCPFCSSFLNRDITVEATLAHDENMIDAIERLLADLKSTKTNSEKLELMLAEEGKKGASL